MPRPAIPVKDDSRSIRCCALFGKLCLKILPIILLVFWVFFGAFIFHIVEEPKALERLNEGDADLAFLQTDYNTWDSKWNYWESLAFVMSLDLSIGYPQRKPYTPGGKVFAIVHFIVALPLLLRSLYVLGDIFCLISLYAHKYVIKLCFHRRKEWKQLNQDPHPVRLTLTNVALLFPIWIVVIILILWILICGACLFGYYAENVADFNPSYGHSLYLFLISVATIGYVKPPGNRAQADILVLCLTFLTLIIIFMLLRLIQRRLEAIVVDLWAAIDERYKRGIILGDAEGAMARNPREAKQGLAVIQHQESFWNRFWLLFLPQSSQMALQNRWMSRANMQCAENQTKESSFEPRMYGIGSSRSEFRKSRDDVNSLVAMLDFTLHPHNPTSLSQEVSTHETIHEEIAKEIP